MSGYAMYGVAVYCGGGWGDVEIAAQKQLTLNRLM